MYLSDRELRRELAAGRLKVTPEPEDSQFQPCSIDLRLGPVLRKYDRYLPYVGGFEILTRPVGIDLGKAEDLAPHYKTYETEGYILESGEFLLGSTLEQISLSSELCAHVDGRSTLGRLGVMIHVTAGFVDPGFQGNITLEIYNVAPYQVRLVSGIGIGQLLVSRVDGVVERPYGSNGVQSKYGGVQEGPVPPNLRRKL